MSKKSAARRKPLATWRSGGKRQPGSRRNVVKATASPRSQASLAEEEADYFRWCSRGSGSAEWLTAHKRRVATWRKAAESDPRAQFFLGLCYVHGIATRQSNSKATRFLAAAADQGHVDAMFQLGHLYLNGEGGERDEEMAFRCFMAAVASGQQHADALVELARCYANGEGVEKDERTAMQCMMAAAALGQEQAKHCFEESVQSSKFVLAGECSEHLHDRNENTTANKDAADHDSPGSDLQFIWGRIQARAKNNGGECSDLVAKARVLIKQGADASWLTTLAQCLRDMGISG